MGTLALSVITVANSIKGAVCLMDTGTEYCNLTVLYFKPNSNVALARICTRGIYNHKFNRAMSRIHAKNCTPKLK